MGARHVVRWVWFPLREVVGFVRRSGRRVAISLLGGLLLVAGVALLVLPGPGFLLIVAGLAVLATEYAWAQRALNAARRRAEAAWDAVLRRGRSGDAPGD
ncbi:MAG TPA: PGPGW domain-containing protein [Actinomycetota bacterium]|nr:PGPGW domain-containing protein [Actinomycetota bacterium]